MARRVLLTGATGLIGCHTAAALAREGFAVRALVRDEAKLARVLAPLGVDLARDGV
ncbi:MAG: NmrA family NAD(P)-binding protein, partial [Myxococcales bacterium]|nr:NmrA family NAD(P)-binding protein [Myxococcales bacterium]